MTEYRGFKYGQNPRGQWFFKFPSGLTATMTFNTEAEIKTHIDAVIAQFGPAQ